MTVTINGTARPVRSDCTLGELIRDLGLGDRPIAVERNREIVSRALFDRTRLRDGDRLEVVHLVGGG